MKYEEMPPYHETKTLELIHSGKEEDIIRGLLSLVLYGENYSLSMAKTLEFCHHPSEYVKGCCIECFGHIARLHGTLDLQQVYPILQKEKHHPSSFVRGKCEDALSDIATFLGASGL